MFYDIEKRKITYLGYKNKNLKKSKNWHFPKGVSPWFWPKIDNLSNFLFKGIRPKQRVLGYFRTGTRLSNL